MRSHARLCRGCLLGLIIFFRLEAQLPTFFPLTEFASGINPSSLVAADFDGDGTLDLAVTDQTLGSVSVFLGVGRGLFRMLPVTFPVGLGPRAIVAGDFNRD